MHECAVNAKNHITADDFKIKCWCGNLKPLLDYLIDDSAPGYYICPRCDAVFDAFTKPKEEWEIALDRLKGIKPTNYPAYNFRYGYKIQVQLMSQQKWFKSRTGTGLPAECIFIGEQRAKVWITCNGRLVVLHKNTVKWIQRRI